MIHHVSVICRGTHGSPQGQRWWRVCVEMLLLHYHCLHQFLWWTLNPPAPHSSARRPEGPAWHPHSPTLYTHWTKSVITPRFSPPLPILPLLHSWLSLQANLYQFCPLKTLKTHLQPWATAWCGAKRTRAAHGHSMRSEGHSEIFSCENIKQINTSSIHK